MSPEAAEADRLRAELAALEQLLEIQERTVAEQSERLEAQSSELQRSNHALEQFAYVISHDLQEPLRMVAAYTELLRESYRDKLGPEADQYIDFASGGARRMQELINALLDYSRVTTRGKAFTRVALDEVLDEALLNLSVAIEERRAEIARGPLPRILGDRSQLVSLLQNLVGNAIKFHEPGVTPHVEIAAKTEGARVDLAVTDRGIGIEPRHHARIFEVFRRVHPKRFAGTGIGLSICQRVAERHGGEIRIDSTPGGGSTFHVVLPAEKESP